MKFYLNIFFAVLSSLALFELTHNSLIIFLKKIYATLTSTPISKQKQNTNSNTKNKFALLSMIKFALFNDFKSIKSVSVMAIFELKNLNSISFLLCVF